RCLEGERPARLQVRRQQAHQDLVGTAFVLALQKNRLDALLQLLLLRALLEELLQFLGNRLLHLRHAVRGALTEDVERPGGTEYAGGQVRADTVRQPLFLADALPQPRLRAAEQVVAYPQRRIVRIAVLERERLAGEVDHGLLVRRV